MEPPTEQRDPRMDFLSNYTCKALRLKEDKWSRMIVSDEQRSYLNNFMEGCWPQARFFFHSRLIGPAPAKDVGDTFIFVQRTILQ